MPTPLPVSPFVTDLEHRFVLDQDAFMAAIEPAPAFLADPRPAYLRACEIEEILQVIRSAA
jgi:hypothetical protein